MRPLTLAEIEAEAAAVARLEQEHIGHEARRIEVCSTPPRDKNYRCMILPNQDPVTP